MHKVRPWRFYPRLSSISAIGLLAVLAVAGCSKHTGKAGQGSTPSSSPIQAAQLIQLNVTGLPDSMEVGSTVQLEVMARLSDGSEVVLTDAVSWNISAPTVLKVNDGVIEALSVGQSAIQAEYQGVTSNAQTVAVTPEATSIVSVSLQADRTAMQVGESTECSVVASYSDGSQLDVTALAGWVLSHVDVIQHPSPSSLLAVGVGQSQVVATWQGFTSNTLVFDVDAAPIADPGVVQGDGALSVSPDDSIVISGPVGGSFAPMSVVLTLLNTTEEPLRWRSNSTTEWLDLSVESGTLAGGESQFVVASLNANASLLATGAHIAQVIVVNMDGEGHEFGIPVRMEVGNVPAAAATFFVDFEGGSDSNDGLSMASPWKHHPWDDNATGVPASTSVGAGSEVILKGGVHYRGLLEVSDSGSSGNPVILDGNTRGTFGEGRAIVDGSEILTNWTPAGDGLYWANLPSEAIDVFRCNLYAGERMLALSQGPATPHDPYHFDDLEEMRSIPPSQVSSTSITDPAVFSALPDDFWVGAHVAIWAKPNFIYFPEIESYNPSTGRITFDAVDPYLDRDTKYAILNSQELLDQPGEYVIDTAAGTVLLWPRSLEDLDEVTASVRTHGLDFLGKDHVTVRGIRFLKHGAGLDMPYQGIAVRSMASSGINNLVFEGNEVAYNRSMSRSGAITVAYGTDCRVSGNFIHHNFRNRGIIVTYGDGHVVEENVLFANGGTGIYFAVTDDSQIRSNLILNHMGTHGNGITLYTNCTECVVSKNQVLDGNIAITTKGSIDLTIAYNVFSVHSSLNGYTVADWGGSTGLTYFNNVVDSHSNKGLFIGSSSLNGASVRNSVIDGMLVNHSSIVNTHNIYTGLSWMQDEEDLSTTDMMASDSVVFVDASVHDYRLVPTSPAIDSGADVVTDLGSVSGAARDIGAFEFAP